MSTYKECQDLVDFVKVAKPNQIYTYYTGLYANDTLLSGELRKLAWDYAIKGIVYLVQSRDGYYFNYIVIKASSPPLNSLIPYIRERESDYTAHQRRYMKRKSVLTPAGAYNGKAAITI